MASETLAPTSPRLAYRAVTPETVDAFHGLLVDPYVRRYLLDGAVVDTEWTRREAETSGQRHADGVCGIWLLNRPGEPAPIGFAGFRVFPEMSPEPQLIYALTEAQTGLGFATEAARACLRFAWARGCPWTLAAIDAVNSSSGRVLDRLGAVRTAVTPDSAFGETWHYRLDARASLAVASTWDGHPVAAAEVARVELYFGLDALDVTIDAPSHGDPPPPGPPGRHPALWNHEVVECFLLGADDRYLELEVGPHGHYLALSLHGQRQLVSDEIPVELESLPAPEGRWAARVRVALEHLPPAVSRVNAYAIHGVDSARRYLAAFPVPGEQPDFHRLAHFGQLVWRDGALATQRP